MPPFGEWVRPRPACAGEGPKVSRSKAAKLFVSFLALILIAVFGRAAVASTSESFIQGQPAPLSAKRAKRTPAGLQASVVYPSDGILTPGQPQMVQIGVTVQPSSGTSLSTYQLRLMLGRNGRKVLSNLVHPTEATSVVTLNMTTVVPGKYELTAELVHEGKSVLPGKRFRIKKQYPVATATPTVTATA